MYETIAKIVQLEMWIFIVGMAGTVLYKIISGEIPLKGLLSEKDNKKSGSLGRAQMLLFTILGSLYILYKVAEEPTKFPEIPMELILLMGMSHSTYLGSKYYKLIRKKN